MNKITHLRISVTQRCNLMCSYCHKEGETKFVNEEMTPQRIYQIVKYGSKCGIDSVKLTGGEPLMREDIFQIVHLISTIKGIKDISLTTNGTLLKGKAFKLKQAGLHRINISCDSTQKISLSKKSLTNILEGLEEAKIAGLSPLKLNMLLLKGVNEGEFFSMLKVAERYKAILQIIELIPTDKEFYKKYYLDLTPFAKKLKKMAYKVVEREMQARRQYFVGNTVVEVVKPLHWNFCNKCNKIRITSQGKLKICLFSNEELEFKDENSIKKAIEWKLRLKQRN